MPQTLTEKKIKTGVLYRSLMLDRQAIDQEKRTVSLSFSSEDPVERWFGTEILDHSPESVRLDRMRQGGPLLCDHNPECQIGVIEDIAIAPDRKGRAIVRFGKSARAEEMFIDVIDGIRSSVSVGYRIYGMILEEEKDGVATYRATDWEPLEISLVSIPSDVSVGVGRNNQADEKEILIIQKRSVNMPDVIETKPPVDVKVIESEARKSEQSRMAEILAIGERHKCMEMAREYITNGKSVDDLRTAVLEKVYKATPVQVADPDIGMSKKEVKSYSIRKAIMSLAEQRVLDGIEREASEAVAKLSRRQPNGFFIPNDVMVEKRALSAGAAASGGFLVGTENLTASMIELLRNRTLVADLGARVLSGLVGNITIPKHAGGGTAYWLSETGTVTENSQTFGQLGLVPHRLSADTAFSKELLMQSSVDVESFVREDLMNILAIEKDRACINGLGANGEPLGIIGTTGIKTVTFGAAATFAKMVDFETQIEGANARGGNRAYITTPATKGKLKTAAKVSAQAIYIWENTQIPGSGMVNGYRAESTLQVPSDKVIFADWSDLIIADWAGIDVVVDPYSSKKTGQIEITITMWTDVGVRHPVSFCVSTDSGAQ